MINKNSLELLAISLRKVLGISPNIILNPTYLDELKTKISKYSCFEIVEAVSKDNVKVLFENDQRIKIFLYGNNEKKFYDLVEMFAFAILHDTKEANSEFYFPRMTNDQGEADYLKLAFMMPKDEFLLRLINYSSAADGTRVNLYKMEKELNKYCYKRGISLGIW